MTLPVFIQRESERIYAHRTWEEMVTVTRDLIALYEGDQLGYVLRWLSANLKNPSIRRRYLDLATYYNVVRFVVDRVATNGYVPSRVIMLDRETGQPATEAQSTWDDLTDYWISGTFSGSIQTLARMTELLRVQSVGVEWDAWNKKVALCAYSAADLKVDYSADNYNKLEPDYYIVTDRYTGEERAVYDLASRNAGMSGNVRYSRDPDRPIPLEIIDPRTGRSMNPFVAFRTFDGSEYYPWDGQEELVHAQQDINRQMTRLSVLAEMGANKTLILSGAWTDAEGNVQPIPMDITQAIKEPDSLPGESDKPKIRWDGPQIVAELDAVMRLVSQKIVQVATQFRISPASITASNDPASGFHAQISEFALAEKHAGNREIFRTAMARLVNKIMLTWNHYGPGPAFPENVRPHIFIPDYMGAASISQHADSDVKLVASGIKRLLPLVLKWEPGIPVELAYRQATQPRPPTQTASVSDGNNTAAVPPTGSNQ